MPQTIESEDLHYYESGQITQAMLRNDEAMILDMYFYNYLMYVKDRTLSFTDEDITIIGYPSINGGYVNNMIWGNGFAIFDSSDNKDAAWNFITYSLSDYVYEINRYSGGYTPTKSAIEADTNEYSNLYFYFLYTGGTISDDEPIEDYYKNMYGEGVDAYSDETLANEYISYFESINNYTYYDSTVEEIVFGEIDDFLNSNRSIDDTVKSIQSRVSLYMSEMWS